MSDRLRIVLTLVVVLYSIVAVRMIHHKKLNLTYSLLWLLMALILLVAVIFPGTVYWLSDLVGVGLPVNMLFAGFALFSLVLMFYLTCIVSRDNEKNRALTQQLALLEKRVRELEDKENGGADR